jgi:hypothetical protein
MLLGLEMRHSAATGVSSHHFIHIIWVYLDFIYNSSDYFNLTDYKQHLKFELESFGERIGTRKGWIRYPSCLWLLSCPLCATW